MTRVTPASSVLSAKHSQCLSVYVKCNSALSYQNSPESDTSTEFLLIKIVKPIEKTVVVILQLYDTRLFTLYLPNKIEVDNHTSFTSVNEKYTI